MTKILEAVALALVVGMFVMVGLAWSGLPLIIPTHYGASGHPDRWGRREFVWVLPAAGLGFWVLLTTVSRLTVAGKIRVNTPRGVDAASPEVRRETARMLTLIKMLMLATFTYIVWRQTTGGDQGLGRLFLPLMLVGPVAVVIWSAVRMRRIGRIATSSDIRS